MLAAQALLDLMVAAEADLRDRLTGTIDWWQPDVKKTRRSPDCI